LTEISVNLTGVSVNWTAIAVNLTGISVNLTGVSVNLTAISVNLTTISTICSYVYKKRKFEKLTRQLLSGQPYVDAKSLVDVPGQSNGHYCFVAPDLART
jgi:hypothetical protein